MGRPADPLGRRALFGPPPDPDPNVDPDPRPDLDPGSGSDPGPASGRDPGAGSGRRALFSSAGPEPAARPPSPAEGSPSPAVGPPSAAARPPSPAEGSPEPAPAAGTTRRLGQVIVQCSSCRDQTPVGLFALGRQLIPSLWWPLRPYPVLMRCPGCHRMTWCRVDWPASLRL